MAKRTGLRQRIEDACAHLKCSMQQFFERAFQFAFGKRRGVLREARSAYTTFEKKGKALKSRARKAVYTFLDGFRGGDFAPAT